MRLLDLFCGGGGAAMGYHRAGFEVVGVDIEPQPNYPFDFERAEGLRKLEHLLNGQADVAATVDMAPGFVLSDFDAIHASPPCQRYSVLRHVAEKKGTDQADLIAPTRELLLETGLPYVIENVPGSPTNHLIVLCGSMFGLGSGKRQLRRHRNFEASFSMLSPPCHHIGEAIGVYGGGPTGRYTFGNGVKRDYYGRRGGYQGMIAEKREAMEIDWMTAPELNQAIPPAYTEHIGYYLRQHLDHAKGRSDNDLQGAGL